MPEITVPGELPTRNEERTADKSNKYGGSQLKNDATNIAAGAALQLPKMEAVQLEMTFYRKDRRTDPDNIISGVKYVIDGLQDANRIKNDGWSQVKPPMVFRWARDKKNPRVEVKVNEREGGLK